MRDVNKVMFTGRLGSNPVVRSAGQAKICSFSIAVAGFKTQLDPDPKPTWVFCEGRDNLGEICASMLVKGTRVYVEGRLTESRWEKDGIPHHKTIVRMSDMIVLSPRPHTEEVSVPDAADSDDLFEAPQPDVAAAKNDNVYKASMSSSTSSGTSAALRPVAPNTVKNSQAVKPSVPRSPTDMKDEDLPL